ncbi:fimbrial protein, partial [Escherichia coli]|nr:fimbrial protein [Escherichia coli]
MKTERIYSLGYGLLAGLLLIGSTHALAVDNNLHFYGNLISRSCTLVVESGNLAEVHFPTISRRDLMAAGESAHVPVVFK